jgi:hypothetical protein
VKRAACLGLLATMLVAVRAEAQVVRRVLSFPREFTSNVAIDDAGSVIYAVTSTNQFGTNPDYRKQIVRWDPVSGAGTQVTDFEEGVESVSVSDDGTWLAFVSCADPLGTNHDESAELFVMHPDGTGLAQLTSENLLPLFRRGIRGAVISGSGNRIAFIGSVNLLGTNPTYDSALFVIDRDGTNLRQLRVGVRLAQDGTPTSYWPGPGLDISDDGSKVVYLGAEGIGGINANGTGNHTFTSTTNATDVVISGNGSKIAYAAGGLESHTVRARTFDGNPGTIVGLGAGEGPSITDDATFVYLYRYAGINGPAGIYRIGSTGGATTLIRSGLKLVGLSGNGSRIVARDTELLAIDNAGGSQQQLTATTVTGAFADELTLSSDGNRLRFSSTIDPAGTNPTHDYEQFSLDIPTGQLTQMTDASVPTIGQPCFTDAGDIFLISGEDLAGQNPCGEPQLYRLSPSGTYNQLTVCGDPYPWPQDYLAVRPDGQVAVFTAEVGFDFETFAVNGDGTGRTQVSPSEPREVLGYGVSVAGIGPLTWVAFVTLPTAVPPTTGGLFRVRADGTGLQLLTPGSAIGGPSISADGNAVAWLSNANYGQNADGSFESFLIEPATGTIHQLTDYVVETFSGSSPQVSQNGQWVFAGEGRYDTSTFALEPSVVIPHPPRSFFAFLPSATGHRWIISEYERLDNDPGTSRLFLADMDALPAFSVSKTSPTELSWDPSPTSMRYDVIRGSIANLSVAGSTVSLGPVSCLEDDSPDSHTRGYGDPVEPAPGQAFFYLYRGSVGFAATVGTYGQGTGGKERVAGSGGCNP